MGFLHIFINFVIKILSYKVNQTNVNKDKWNTNKFTRSNTKETINHS